MPPPVPPSPAKALPPPPATVTMPPVPDAANIGAVGRPGALTAGQVPDRLSDPYLSRALQAQFLVGNAAVAAALLSVPSGGPLPGAVLPSGPGAPGVLAPSGPVPGVPAPPGPDVAGALAGPPKPAAVVPAAATAAPPVAAAPGAPDTQVARPRADKDPKFAALKRDVHTKKQRVAASHPPPQTEASSAQGAARPPADDKVAQGKVANADKMNDAKPKAFDKAAFIKAVQQAIAQQAPKNLDEADKFADSDKPAQVKKDVQGRVDQGKDESQHDIATTTAAPPDTSKAVTKQVVPMSPDRPPGAPATPDPANAVPDKLPPSATDLSGGPRQVDAQMAAAQVTEPQLAHSNEPTFTAAVQAKYGAEQDSARATPAMRGHESATLKAATADAQQQGTAGMHQLAGARVAAGQKVTAGKQGAKGSDEAKRAQVTGILQKVFDATKADVDKLLSDLDRMVDQQFTREEKQARDAFTAEHKWKMTEYKAKRYSGPLGLWRWGKDKLLGLPKEADQIFTTARDHYIARMQTVISNVADTIGTQLDAAMARIAKGRADLQDTVKKLPADLRAIGAQAAEDFAGKFDELNQQVDEKSNDLVQTLASKYNEALKSVDDEIAKEKEKNRGLVAKAVDAVAGVIKTIMELKNLLLGVLRKAASAIMLILKDPIGFLKNLVGAVGAGLKQFLKNIVRHLEQGLVTWLLGVTAQAGLSLPKSFDVKGILMLIAGLLGLTWQFVRSRIVRKIPEKVVAAVETGVTLIMKIRREGIAGLWDEIKAQIGDLKHTLIAKVTEFLLPTIIVAGIMWVLSLLNPASAFVRACKLIIDIIQFIVERGRQIIDFVNAVLDAVIAIAKGGTGGVPGLIENALARSIPVLIGFLASLLGIGGIADKVKKIFQTLSKPVMKAIDWVVDKIVGLVKRLWAKLKAILDKAKQKVGLGKDGKPKKDDKHKDAGKIGADLTFTDAGRTHRLYIVVGRGTAAVMVATTPMTAAEWLDHLDSKVTGSGEEESPKGARALIALARSQATATDAAAADAARQSTTGGSAGKAQTATETENQLRQTLDKLGALFFGITGTDVRELGSARLSRLIQKWDDNVKGNMTAERSGEGLVFLWHRTSFDSKNEASSAGQEFLEERYRAGAITARTRTAFNALLEEVEGAFKREFQTTAGSATAAKARGVGEHIAKSRRIIEALTEIRYVHNQQFGRINMPNVPAVPLPPEVRVELVRLLRQRPPKLLVEPGKLTLELTHKAELVQILDNAIEGKSPLTAVPNEETVHSLTRWKDLITQPEMHHIWPQWLTGRVKPDLELWLPRILHNFGTAADDPGFHQVLNDVLRTDLGFAEPDNYRSGKPRINDPDSVKDWIATNPSINRLRLKVAITKAYQKWDAERTEGLMDIIRAAIEREFKELERAK